jgi:hypothetical protein
MERKHRRGVAGLAATAAEIRRANEPEETTAGAPARRGKRQAVGARVARVAVDDETWAAFRDLCGPTPASIRLGELVIAEVERSRNPATARDMAAAVQAIRSQVDALAALIRRAV